MKEEPDVQNSFADKSFASHPTITNVNAKMFEPDEALSKITRAPLDVKVSA